MLASRIYTLVLGSTTQNTCQERPGDQAWIPFQSTASHFAPSCFGKAELSTEKPT